LIEGVSEGDLPQLDEACILVELRLGAVEDSAIAGEPGFADRHRQSGAGATHDFVVEVGITEDEVPLFPHERLFGRAEMVERALGLIARYATLANIQQSADRKALDPKRGAERAGPIGIGVADHVVVGDILHRVAGGIDV
jgi:hypothetical protein